jgi:hypothetical protein
LPSQHHFSNNLTLSESATLKSKKPKQSEIFFSEESSALEEMTAVLLWVVCPVENAQPLLSLVPRNGRRGRSCKLSSTGVSAACSSAVAHPSRSSEERVYEVVLKQAALVKEQRGESALDLKKPIESDGMADWNLLNEAYQRCGEVCAEYAKTFYLGTSTFCLSCVCLWF